MLIFPNALSSKSTPSNPRRSSETVSEPFLPILLGIAFIEVYGGIRATFPSDLSKPDEGEAKITCGDIVVGT